MVDSIDVWYCWFVGIENSSQEVAHSSLFTHYCPDKPWPWSCRCGTSTSNSEAAGHQKWRPGISPKMMLLLNVVKFSPSFLISSGIFQPAMLDYRIDKDLLYCVGFLLCSGVSQHGAAPPKMRFPDQWPLVWSWSVPVSPEGPAIPRSITQVMVS